jgi:hypothetical protein
MAPGTVPYCTPAISAIENTGTTKEALRIYNAKYGKQIKSLDNAVLHWLWRGVTITMEKVGS